MTDLICLTVRQPWAWAIVAGLKDVENRTWSTKRRGLLGIHAGLRVDSAGFEFLRSLGIELPAHLPTEALVGAVDLVAIADDSPSPWAFLDCRHWLLDSARMLDRPIPMRGKMGLFGAPASVADAFRHTAGDLHESASDHHPSPQRSPLFPIAESDVPLPFEPGHC